MENHAAYDFEFSPLVKDKIDYENRTASYNLNLMSRQTNKYKEIYRIIKNGYQTAYQTDWTDLKKDWPDVASKDCTEPGYCRTGINTYQIAATVSGLYFIEYEILNNEGNSLFDNNETLSCVSAEKMKIIDAGNYSIVPGNVMLCYGDKYNNKIQDLNYITLAKNNVNIGTAAKPLVRQKDAVNVIAGYFFDGKVSFSTSIKLVHIKGGTFQMGKLDGYDNEKPVHNVTVSPFYMSTTEVTQSQYQAVMAFNPSEFKGENRPVEQLSWYDAIVFCNKLSILDGKPPCYSVNGNTNTNSWGYQPHNGSGMSAIIECNFKSDGYRLPTEAEWEYAARGGQNYIFAGSDNIDEVAWYCNNSGYHTNDVACKKSNGYGLFDMSGNVWEWCWDWYSSGFYSKSPSINPSGPASGSVHVIRGGSYNGNDNYCRITLRSSAAFNFSDILGFRIACSSTD